MSRCRQVNDGPPGGELESASSTYFGRRWQLTIVESGLIFCLFYIYAGLPPPDANESHYLAKAKNFWNPEWCARDLFLQSEDAHYLFYLTVGSLTQFLSLPATAWIGRVAAWMLLATGWCHFSRGLAPRSLLSVLTAAWFLVFHHHGTMAGEWLVGGVEGKSFAYGFVLWGLGDLVRGRWNRVWMWLGAASAMHVLVGGWSVLAAGFSWACSRRKAFGWGEVRSILPGLAVGFLLAAPSIVAGLRLTWGVDPEMVREANQILVYTRLPHHLAFHRFSLQHILRFVALAIAWLVVSRRAPFQNPTHQRLRDFVLASLLFTLAGVALDLLSFTSRELASSWLKYYWFRLADVMVPVAAAITLVIAVWESRTTHSSLRQAGILLLLLAPPLLLLPGLHEGIRAPRARAVTLWDDPSRPLEARIRRYQEWLDVCRWVRENTPEDALFLTPWSQQSFKWFAHRAEVFNWKDMPQDPAHLLRWQERRRTLFPRAVFLQGYTALEDDELWERARKYDAEYLVVRRWKMTRPLGHQFEPLYPTLQEENASFAVYRIVPQLE